MNIVLVQLRQNVKKKRIDFYNLSFFSYFLAMTVSFAQGYFEIIKAFGQRIILLVIKGYQ